MRKGVNDAEKRNWEGLDKDYINGFKNHYDFTTYQRVKGGSRKSRKLLKRKTIKKKIIKKKIIKKKNY